VICDLPDSVEAATWGPDGKILMAACFSDQAGLYHVSERGGDPKLLFAPPEGKGHSHGPHVLPDNRAVLVTHHVGGEMRLSVLDDGSLTTLLALETSCPFLNVYSEPGHLLYQRGGTDEGVWALPFSLDTLDATGEPFMVADGGGGPSVSRNGTLIYKRVFGSGLRRLVWVDRQGEVLGSIG
jgi:hypothetical protein